MVDIVDNGDGVLYLYSEDEMRVVENHIREYIGSFDSVFHEIVSEDIHVDIIIVPPANGRNHYTVTTLGMGAYLMDIPKKFQDSVCPRIELAITLPATWDFSEEAMQDESNYWPIRLLKNLAHLPIYCDTFLAPTHTVDNEDFYGNTKFSGVVLDFLQDYFPLDDDDAYKAHYCDISEDEGSVQFLQVIPLYKEELDYAVENGSPSLFDIMEESNFSFCVDIKRKNLLK